MKTVNVITVVPKDLAINLSQKRKITDYNTLPQLNVNIIEAVREFMTENVGYANLPMACLRADSKMSHMSTTDLFHYLPTNNRENVLFVMQIPDDMIVSVGYQTLLDASEEASSMDDESSIGILKDYFKEELHIGSRTDEEETIEFIPFLDYSRCKGYAKFNDEFETEDFSLPGVERCSLAKLSAFIN